MQSGLQQVDFAFLDSGAGGIPYLGHLKKKLPQSKCVYLADSANFPYGTKTREEIISCATEACEKLTRNFSPQAIVIACNTISVTALPALRKSFPSVPIVGTVPAIKLAASVTRNKKIGLLATSATVRNEYIEKLRHDFAAGCEVVCRADDELIYFIEHKFFDATEKEKYDAVVTAVDFFRQKKCDTVILGCTHFLHLAEAFEQAAGSDIKIVDSREGVANQAIRVISNFSDACEKNKDCSAAQDDAPVVYVSGFAKETDEAEYNLLCRRLGLRFGGILH